MKQDTSSISLVFNDQPLDDEGQIRFQFDAYANALTRLIASDRTRTPLTIGINGEWGSGKTTLMKAIKRRLDETHGSESSKSKFLARLGISDTGFSGHFRECKTVWFNAWKYSKEEELFAALIQEILKHMKRDGFISRLYAELNDPNQPEVKLPEAVINAIFQIFSLGQIDLDLSRYEIDSRFKTNLAFYDEFQDFFDQLLAWYVSGRRDTSGQISEDVGVLVIFIDDLDRCLPEKTIQVLESIKLFMDKIGTVFVLGADLNLIASAIEAHYDQGGIRGITSHDYLEKIIQIRFDLPPIDKGDMQSFIAELPNVDEDLRGALEIIAGGLDTNPRKVKVFINHIELQWAIIVDAKLDNMMEKGHLIEWLVLRATNPAFADYILSIEDASAQVSTLKEMSNFAKIRVRQEKLHIDSSARRVFLGDRPVPLSELEYRFLEFLEQNQDRVVTRDELARAVYDYEDSIEGVTDQAIDSLVHRLRRRIEPNPSQPAYLLTIRGRGYSLNVPSLDESAPDLSPSLQQFAEDLTLLRVLARGKYEFTEESIGLYIHFSPGQDLKTEDV